jgi:hypothetical protein
VDIAIAITAMSESAPPTSATGAAATTGGYDRWNLRDPPSISYGYYSGSANKSSSNELSPSASAAGAGAAAAAATASNDNADTKQKKGFYITTAINYTNGPAHMGHAYEAASADAIARFARLNHKSSDGGIDCYFVTGADEHGEKIAKTAEKEGKAPIEICDKVRNYYYSISNLFAGSFSHLNDPQHLLAVRCRLPMPQPTHPRNQRRLRPHHLRSTQTHRPSLMEPCLHCLQQ